jgi:amidase
MNNLTDADADGRVNDVHGAFCHHNPIRLPATGEGALSGLRFALKDVFDVMGERAGWGHPDWLADQVPAAKTASAVTRVLAAGAELVGKTVCDELCYSLTGENIHYGTPRNPAAPDRLPGGSSSGSAVAVAAGLVDFAIGTDCGGSVRVPASYCGIFGLRPTHGRVAADGVHPFAADFDCVGWFARDAAMLARVGRPLLGADAHAAPVNRLLIADDAFALADAFDGGSAALSRIAALVGQVEHVVVSPDGLRHWYEAFRVIQAAQVWASMGGWATRRQPRFGEGVRARLTAASQVDADAVRAAGTVRRGAVDRLRDLLVPGTVLCLPTVPGPAPRRDASFAAVEVQRREAAMQLLCSAGLAGLPQITLPWLQAEGLPLGLSLVGTHGADVGLLDFVAELTSQE